MNQSPKDRDPVDFEQDSPHQLLTLTAKGFIYNNELKFQSQAQENPAFSDEYSLLDQENLDLSKGKFTVFREKSCFSLLQMSSNLQDLDLSSNNLAFFPIELVHLLHLRILRLDHNEIKSISIDIDRLINLEFLSISNNQLSILPNSFSKMQKLKVLNIGKNLIKDIQPIVLIKSLEILYLYGNPFVFLPTNFGEMKNIKEFALEWFKYTEPGINPILKKPQNSYIFDRLFALCATKQEKHEEKYEEKHVEKKHQENYIEKNEEKSQKTFTKKNFFQENQSKGLEMLDFLRFFSKDSLDFLQKDSKGRNLLHNAAFEDEIGVLSAIASKFPKLLNLIDKDGQTPLTLALLEEKYRSAEILLDFNGDLTVGGGIFGSALHLAVSKLRRNLVEKLLKGLSLVKNLKILYDFDQNSPFHILFSIFSKDYDEAEAIGELLLDFGLDPNEKNKELYTALHIAIKKNQLKAVKFAIEFNNKKKKKIFQFNKKGGMAKWSLAHLAAFLGNFEALQLLQETNIDVFQENSGCQTAMKVCFQSIIVIKTIRKMEKKWVLNNIVNRSLGVNSEFLENIHDSEVIIARNMKKKQQFFLSSGRITINPHQYPSTPIKTHQSPSITINSNQSPSSLYLLKLENPKEDFSQFLKSRKVNNEDIYDESPYFSKEKSMKKQYFNEEKHMNFEEDEEILKINDEITEEHEDLDEYLSEENITQKMLNKSSQFLTINLEKPQKNRIYPGIFSYKRKEIEDFLVFKEEKKMEKELKRLEKAIEFKEISLSEKIAGFFYLKAIKMRINEDFIRFSSVRLPINLFLLNEAIFEEKKWKNTIENSIENLLLNTIIVNLSTFRKKSNEFCGNKQSNFNKELGKLRIINENLYEKFNLLLFILQMESLGFLDVFKGNIDEKFENFPKILCYEMMENLLKNSKNRRKSTKKRSHLHTKSMNNVSVIINNNFYFTRDEKERRKNAVSVIEGRSMRKIVEKPSVLA